MIKLTSWGLSNRWTATLFDHRLNLSKIQTLKWQWLLNKKELGACKSPGRNPNGLQHDTRASGSKDGDAAPWLILDVHLFRRFPSTQKDFWCGTSVIRSLMKLWFQPYIECGNLTPYVGWVSNLRQTAPALRGGLEVELDWVSNLACTPLLYLHASKPFSMHLLILSLVPNHNIINR
jgi:hypothetical protein